MSSKMSGIYRAEVVDTDSFLEQGKIKVRVHGFTDDNSWEKATIVTPFGGGPNMGMVTVPPIGAQGYVMFERDMDTYPIWLGSVLQYQGKWMKDKDAAPVEMVNPSDFIIKTQYTTVKAKDFDNKDNKIENIIKLNENALYLGKFQQGDKYKYEKASYNLDDDCINSISITDTYVQMRMKFKDNSKANEIIVAEDKITLVYDVDSSTMMVTIANDSITLTSGGSTVTMKKDGNIEIMSNKEIHLNGDDKSVCLWEGFNDFVQTFNSHTHGTPSGPSSPPVTTYSQANQAKSKNVKAI
jgi:hypothetical protein